MPKYFLEHQEVSTWDYLSISKVINWGEFFPPIIVKVQTLKKLLFLLLLFCCDDRVEDPTKSNIIVTMLRVDRIEILDWLWITPAPIWGHLESEDSIPLERMVVHWWSNMYWDEDDSSGHYRLLPNRRNKAIWYDNFGNRDTMDVDVDTLRWTTDRYSEVDSLGYFFNTLRPTRVMQNKGSGSWMKLYWSIENTLIDSQEIFLMD